ncbi:dihydroorotase, multifunctional complex type [Thermoplasmatales archaeon SCGC AB-539-N05]|nr:dihydroorotase, multifunctional complex type [Thermoplasmatales archaeon SCGC AB-539-N05]
MDLSIEGRAFVNGCLENCCIGITDGKICVVKKILRAAEHHDFKNKLILPAGIDMHVHFRDPGSAYKEDFSTGTLAAAHGGISCVFDMPNTIPQTTTLQTISDKIVVGEEKAHVDFGVYAGVTDRNVENIEELAKRCCGFKIYLGNTTNYLRFNTDNLKETFNRIELTNKPVLIHAEDEQCLAKHKINERDLIDHLRSHPPKCEEIAINSIFAASRKSKAKIHICHLSSQEGLELLRTRSKNITCGVTPHHLLFAADKNLDPQAWYKANPPLRTSFDRTSLFGGIKNNLIDVLESDHAPHTLEEKERDFDEAPSGVPGVETMFPLLLFEVRKGNLALGRLVSLLCEKPSSLLNVSKGRIEEGKDADLIVVDLKEQTKIKAENLYSKCGWSPFEGMPAVFPTDLFVRGERIMAERELIGERGFGRFVGA